MDNTMKSQVLEILDYWRTIEFLGQTDIPEESPENKSLMEKILKGKNPEGKKADKIEVFHFLETPYLEPEEMLEEDLNKFTDFGSIGGEIAFCLGRIDRNSVVEYLEKYVENPEQSPEIAYPKKSAIAWCSFKTDAEGKYQQGSFRLSPILWAIDVWDKSGAGRGRDFYLNTDEYDEIINAIDRDLQDRNVTGFLAGIYEKIQKEYVRKNFSQIVQENLGFYEYNRYVDEEARDKDEDPVDYADLGKSFFLNDIELMCELIRSGKFGDGNRYEKQVVAYILAGQEKSKGMGNIRRTIISPTEPAENIRRFFEKTLNVADAPMGKWPSKFMPALMQQVAVNIAIRKDDSAPVFSVNGPPGTGKTTLLKEIVASNIVDRAYLLAKAGRDPDDLFEKHNFDQGPLEEYGNAYYKYAPNYYSINDDRINNYGMLVASCNNAAVENITIDLPKGGDIIGGLEAADDDPEDVKAGLAEVRELFDVNKSEDIETIKQYGKSRKEKDIYFTRYANKLLGNTDCWGLVSAPFGKRSNIRKYCVAVLKPFVEEYKSNESRNLHKEKYETEREKFLQQYKKVQAMKAELELVCKQTGAIPQEWQEISEDSITSMYAHYYAESERYSSLINTEQRELMKLKETKPGWLWRSKKLSDRKKSIAEKENLIAGYKKKQEQIQVQISELKKVIAYKSMIQKYSKGAKKIDLIDGGFIERYRSPEEKPSTKAQVTNPWFNAEYNREREKLFFRACKLHKEFAAASKCLRHNVINLMIAWNMFDDCGERMSHADKERAMPSMLQSIFLLTPVISTTFASAQSFLGDIVQSGVLGTLIVDEAGQAQPQMAVGAMMRCRKAVIVGDPKQIEPVVTAETDMFKQLLTSKLLAGYKNKKISVQGFADYINPYGTFLMEDEEREWVGCPLVVHRRCIDPMYSISNILSYNETMKQQTGAPKESKVKTFIMEKSCWINVTGSENSGAKDHFVKAQGEVVLKLLAEKFRKEETEIPHLFIITPFTSVKAGMINMIRRSQLYREEPRVKKWLDENNVGTVHTFQGQGTDEVIFLLGCDRTSIGAVNWVNKNIVNVAATRAKFRFYVIGDKTVWTCKPVRIARECISEIITADELDRMLGLVADEKMNDDAEKTQEQLDVPVMVSELNAASTPGDMICPECGKLLKERKGKFGKFIGCTGYPACRYTRNA